MTKVKDDFFAVTAPGLEEVCAAEMEALGLDAVRCLAGGVAFAGGLRELYLANLWLRSASRVLVRVGEVRADAFPELFRKTVRLPWGRFVRRETPVRVRVTSHCSRLRHSGRIAETVAAAVDRSLGRAVPPAGGEPQLVLVRLENDLCTFSVDSSGELLHRRGYRLETAFAPLRETLAAGVLQLLAWDGSVPLLDPMCGSGTLLIEGALLASRRPPGERRSFAFMGWPRYRPGLWAALKGEAGRLHRPVPAAITGTDRDPRALAAARRNAERAGVEAVVQLRVGQLREAAGQEEKGLVLCNPPYGERLGREDDLRPLYRTLGQVFRQGFAGWRGAFLCPEEGLARASGLPLEKVAKLSNGGISVGLYVADL